MKKYFVVTAIMSLNLLFVSCKKNEEPQAKVHVYGEAFDIENNNYISVEIDGKMWFTENLSCRLFTNGDTIVEAKTDDEWEVALNNGVPAWSYPNNDSTLSESCGIIYNYHAITDSRGLAPEGWHISTSDEWQKLIDNYGGEWTAGYHLKSTTGWENDGNGSNSTKFNAFPGTYRLYIGSFMGGENGWWWTSTPIDSVSGNYAVLLPSINNFVNILDNYGLGYGFYVRCVQD